LSEKGDPFVFLRPAILALSSLLAPASVAVPAGAPAATSVMASHASGTAFGPGWAGYVAQGTRFRYVQAEFRLTRLDCAKTPGTSRDQAQMADWVGLDGWWPSKTVEQDGIGGFCDDGVASYSAWWETYPKPPHYIFNVDAGDTFMATAFYSHGEYRLELVDYTSGQSFGVWERCGASRCGNSSAEVITEDPGKATKTYQDYPFADSGTTEFWNIKVTNQAGLKGNFNTNPWTNYQVTMTDKAKDTMMSTSSLFDGGTAFQTYWKREF
jgi:hypothetical protein